MISLGILICLSWKTGFSSANLTFSSNFLSHFFLNIKPSVWKTRKYRFLGPVLPILTVQSLLSSEESLPHVGMKSKRGPLRIFLLWVPDMGKPTFYRDHCSGSWVQQWLQWALGKKLEGREVVLMGLLGCLLSSQGITRCLPNQRGTALPPMNC